MAGDTPATTSVCELCGFPMPPGEEVFRYHGYSGPCPTPPTREQLEAALVKVDKASRQLREEARVDWRTLMEPCTI